MGEAQVAQRVSETEFAALRDSGYRLLTQSRLPEALALLQRLLQMRANDLPSRLLMGRLCLLLMIQDTFRAVCCSL